MGKTHAEQRSRESGSQNMREFGHLHPRVVVRLLLHAGSRWFSRSLTHSNPM
jgi:hypothetical protein